MSEVIVLVATYNGSKYIEAQLKSLLEQSLEVDIILRDDSSQDNTAEIIENYESKYKNIYILDDNKKSFSAKENFSILLDYAVALNKYNYFMFCDQDDIWKKNKVELTLIRMKELEKQFINKPLLVHTDLEVVDKSLNTISRSMWEYEKISPNLNSLNRLLIQNTITGCTMMINRALAQKCLVIPKEAIMHDWWIGLVASNFGKINFIKESTIMYRQHTKNDTGTNKFNLTYIIKRLSFSDIYKYINQAKLFLDIFEKELDNNTKRILTDFSTIKEKPYPARVYTLFKYNLFKYGFFRNLGLILKI